MTFEIKKLKIDGIPTLYREIKQFVYDAIQKTENRKPEAETMIKTCASIAKNVMEIRGTARAKREGEQPGRQVDVLFLRSVSVLSVAFCMFFEPGKVKWMERKNKKPLEKSERFKAHQARYSSHLAHIL